MTNIEKQYTKLNFYKLILFKNKTLPLNKKENETNLHNFIDIYFV
jgi:hypothetical protein